MKVTADTNILVRVTMNDDALQSELALELLERAEVVALTLPVLCEWVWVLSSGYRIAPAQIAHALRILIDSDNVVFDRPAVDAGLAQLDAGGDFADGVIAYQGSWLGGETFVTFDKKAVTLMTARGVAAQLLK